MRFKLPPVLVILNSLLYLCSGARILAIVPFRVDSHFPMFENLLKGLAACGHEVVMVSHYPQKTPAVNYTDISLLGSLPNTRDNVSLSDLENINNSLFATFFLGFAVNSCEAVYKHEGIKQLLSMEDNFDLIINEIWGNDCFLGISHKFHAPHIGVITSIAYPWSSDRIGNLDNPSYIPNFFLPYSSKMNLLQRILNTLLNVGTKLLHYFISELPTQRIARDYFGKDMPQLSEISRTTSLILVNSHFSIHHSRPMVPAFIEVAGLHIKEPKKLPQDIQKYIDEANHGVIFFSFGTMVRPETMSSEKMQYFLEVFAKLPQRILWKCHQEQMPSLPSNIRCFSWLPQSDVLGHPNVRLFITHGGMMGTQEAVQAGVPMLGFPLFADQMLNIHNYVSKGVAMKVDFATFSKDDLREALNTLLYDTRYEENAKRLSKLFRDRPLSALDTAIYWSEYVIKHKGAPHLKTSAVYLQWFQYMLLDVTLVLLAIATVIIYVIQKIFKRFFFPLHLTNLIPECIKSKLRIALLLYRKPNVHY